MSQHPIPWEDLVPGQHRLPCPYCSGSRANDKALSVKIDPDFSGVAYCHRCQRTEPKPNTAKFASRTAQGPRTIARSCPLPAAVYDHLSPNAVAIWEATAPISPGTAAATYLLARHCMLPPEGSDLRWLTARRHPSGHRGPCLVARLTDPLSGEARSLHFTWIDGDRKAEIDTPRLYLGNHRKGHAVCRLWPGSTVTDTLGVAEGLETALSLSHAISPVWACMDAGTLKKFPVLPGLARLFIACDRDPAGESAAHTCAQRYAAAGVHARVSRQECNDLNDVLMKGMK